MLANAAIGGSAAIHLVRLGLLAFCALQVYLLGSAFGADDETWIKVGVFAACGVVVAVLAARVQPAERDDGGEP